MSLVPESVYQPEIDRLMKELEADGIVLIVVGGKRGNGAGSTLAAERLPEIVSLLRKIADNTEQFMGVSRLELR